MVFRQPYPDIMNNNPAGANGISDSSAITQIYHYEQQADPNLYYNQLPLVNDTQSIDPQIAVPWDQQSYSSRNGNFSAENFVQELTSVPIQSNFL